MQDITRNYSHTKQSPDNLSDDGKELLGPLVDFVGTWANK